MKILVSTFAAIGLLALGTATASAASAGYCDNYARTYANQRAGGNAIGGAVLGGIGGAALGGILGGKNAVGTGAIVGGVGGAAVGGSSWQRLYNDAYYRCMNSAPAYKPQPVYGTPPVGSKAWKQRCSYKYKSFDWKTGYYLGYDGQYHVCALP
jgi:hypothetical protein